MPLTIENLEVEKLAIEVAALANETETEAIKQALLQRRLRLQSRPDIDTRRKNLFAYLQKEVWPFIPAHQLGKVMTREEEDEIQRLQSD